MKKREYFKVFKDADSNQDQKISLGESECFQHWLVRNFDYKENNTALRPDVFLARRGGDCEDFAIMTCCMLNYHGIIAYGAGFGRVTTNKHAVCMVQIKKPVPPGFLYYTLEYWNIPDGIYTPIDYNTVGGLEAIDRRWKIARINKPKDMYDKYW